MTFLKREEVYTAEDARKVRSEYPSKEAKRLAKAIADDIRGLPNDDSLKLTYGLFKDGPKENDPEIWLLVKAELELLGYNVTYKPVPWWKRHFENGYTLVEW